MANNVKMASSDIYWLSESSLKDGKEVLEYAQHILPANELLKTASDSLALRGIYLRYGHIPDPELRNIVAEPPDVLDFYPPAIEQTVSDAYVFSNKSLDKFNQVQSLGFSIPETIKAEGLKRDSYDQRNTDISYRGIHTTVPTARCTLDYTQMKLSAVTLNELKGLEARIQQTQNKDTIYSECQTFFQRFGSHVMLGDVHFGGVYKWEAKCQGVRDHRGLVEQSLDTYIITGDTSSSQVELSTRWVGGPAKAPSFEFWKLGLEADRTTWTVVDREKEYVGIWEILKNHSGDLKDAEGLGLILEKAWEKETLHVEQENERNSLLHFLGIEKFYPSKLFLDDIMQLEGDRQRSFNRSEVVFSILQKLITLDYRSFTSELQNFANSRELGQEKLNPLDVFLTIFACCDLNLRQVLVRKMVQCRLAFPFISPGMCSDALTFSLWPLRGIVLEFMDEKEKAYETSLTSFSPPTVSFIKLGNPKLSKSRILNHVLSDQYHDTFFNRDCALGNTNKVLANGLLEASFSLSGGRKSDAFKSATMFLNMRGDASKHPKQVCIISRISDVIVVSTDISDLTTLKVKDTLKTLTQNSESRIVILLTNRTELSEEKVDKISQEYSRGGPQMMQLLAFEGSRDKNISDLKGIVRDSIAKCLDTQFSPRFSFESVDDAVRKEGIHVDEDEGPCKMAKLFADGVIAQIRKEDTCLNKSKLLPLHGELWQGWVKCLKATNKRGTLEDVGKMEKEMSILRRQQGTQCDKLNPLMDHFISGLSESIRLGCADYFLQWLRLYLDDLSRQSMPALWQDYHVKSDKLLEAKKNVTENHNLQKLEEEQSQSEKMLMESVFGIEHLFREMGQMYEAVHYAKCLQYDKRISNFPHMAAELISKGHTLELMDGDASGVPEVWIEAVMSCLEQILDKKKIFTVAVLGIQSSGKTTLLNTMFGLQLPVSAGRCTRGVYMRLVETREGSNLPFDYMLLLDTEGLRAPEIGESSYDHDNELATFVIGLGDATIINIKGENVSEVKDILQIVVHAFLRMKVSNGPIQKSRSCVFVHQNVDAVNAEEKMRLGQEKFKEELDKMTCEAASLERISDVKEFKDIIHFKIPKYISYFSGLWQGKLPMAPANPAYHEEAQSVKKFIVDNLAMRQDVFLGIEGIASCIHDMWNGVMADDFIFTFRNSYIAIAYSRLEIEYVKLKAEMEKHMRSLLSGPVAHGFENCRNEDELKKQETDSNKSVCELGNEQLKDAISLLETFIEGDEQKCFIKQWEEDKKCSLHSLAECIKSKALHEIQDMIDYRKVSFLEERYLEKHKLEIGTKARQLATELKGKKEEDFQHIDEQFEHMWAEWIKEISCKETSEVVDIWEEFCVRLNVQYRCHLPALNSELNRKLQSKEKSKFPLFDFIKNIPKMIRREKKHSWVRRVEAYLEELTTKKGKFQLHYAQKVIDIVVEVVQLTNDDNPNPTVSKEKEIRWVIQACRKALPVFKKMQEEYEETSSVAAKLRKYKTTTYNLFVNRVKQSTAEETVADYLRDQFEEPVKDTVQARINQMVVNEIVQLFYGKRHLIRIILKELAENENFDDYQSYISSPKTFVLDWLKGYTDKHITENRGGAVWYTSVIAKYTKEMCSAIQDAAEKATQCVSGQSTLSSWISFLSESLKDQIALPVGLKASVKQEEVKDFQNLNTLLSKGINTIQSHVISHFESNYDEQTIWGNQTLYKEIRDRIWGCEALCPFCAEPCKKSDPNHASETDCHECVQHRPNGVNGWSFIYTKKLIIESCSYNVQTDKKFICIGIKHICSSDNEVCIYHPYRDYKKHFPEWDIPPTPNMDSSQYWKWYLNRFQTDIVRVVKCKLPDMPESWKDVTKDEAIESLYNVYGLQKKKSKDEGGGLNTMADANCTAK